MFFSYHKLVGDAIPLLCSEEHRRMSLGRLDFLSFFLLLGVGSCFTSHTFNLKSRIYFSQFSSPNVCCPGFCDRRSRGSAVARHLRMNGLNHAGFRIRLLCTGSGATATLIVDLGSRLCFQMTEKALNSRSYFTFGKSSLALFLLFLYCSELIFQVCW